MNMRFFSFTLLLFSLFPLLSEASLAPSAEYHTHIVNINAYIYGGGNKNWSVATDKDGLIYVANNNGLLAYNGLKWRLYTDAPCAIMRSVAVGSDNRIYTGGFREFGVWEKDEAGMLTYRSLSDLLTDVAFKDEDIWRIRFDKDNVYFQSFSRIYKYNGEDVEVIDPRRFIMFLEPVGDKLYIEKNGELNELSNKGLSSLGMIGATTVKVILPFGEKGEDLLLGTVSGDLFRYDGNKISKWNSATSGKLKGMDLNTGIRLKNGHYLIGTLGSGIVELDEAGEFVYHYTTSNGLQNNSVQALCEDVYGNVWVAMDEGLAKLEFSPKINYFMDASHKLGAVYDAAVYENKLYLGTNKGLVYIPVEALRSSSPFDYMKRVEGSRSQVWSLHVFDDALICGDNNGAFQVRAGKAAYIYEGSGVLAMTGLERNNRILLSTYHTPALLKRENGAYRFETLLRDFSGVCNTVDMDNLEFIWMGHLYEGLFQTVLLKDSGALKQLNYFPSSAFSDKGKPVKVSRFGHRTLFLHDDRFFFYNELEQQIESFDILDKLKIPVDRINKIIPLDAYHYWIMGKNSFGLIAYINGNAAIRDVTYFDGNQYATIDDYENIAVLNDSLSLICLNNGFALYHHAKKQFELPVDRIYPDRVVASGQSVNARNLPLNGLDTPELPNASNTVTFDLASPNNQTGESYYIYMLEGMDSAWSKPVNAPTLSYERLPQGDYTLRIRPLNADLTENPEAESVFSFRILAPWYFSRIAISFWSVLLILFFVILFLYMTRRHRKELRRQAERNEELRMREKNTMLEEMVKHKNNELFQVTANMLRKNEMLTEIKDEIENFTSRHPDTSISKKLSRIARAASDETVAKEDWSLFIMHFEQTHENFFKHVKEAYPTFTPAELKLCACLKLNLSTKDIASLLNISVRGVEAGRYRLRKKIDIDQNESLNDFFIRKF